jgi:hypothetical protein
MAARERRLVDDHEGIEGVAIVRERLDDVAVIGWVVDRRVEHAVEDEHAAVFVELVLVAAAAWDLDQDLDPVGCALTRLALARIVSLSQREREIERRLD